MAVTTHLEAKVSVLEAELRGVYRELKELKEIQRDLVEFMYKVEGGKAWLFGLLAIAGTLGGVLSSGFSVLFKH